MNNNLYDDYEIKTKSKEGNSSQKNNDSKKEKKSNHIDNNKQDFYSESSFLQKNRKLILLILFALIVLSIAGSLIYMKMGSKKVDNNNTSDEKQEVLPDDNKVDTNVKIVDLNDKRRPYGIMINNHHAAWPQSGLSKAYMIYEIMVEGGITRMFALYTQAVDVEKIGSCRSVRHNYLDYAMENDAILVHFGGSYVAEAHIPRLGIDHIDGNYADSSYFYRDRSLGRALEHTAFTTSDNIKKAIQNHGFRNERNKDYLLNYVSKEVNLSDKTNNQVANNISIKYSDYQTSSYQYNSDEKVYYRFMSGVKHTDLVTGEHYHFKNIIVYSITYTSYPGESGLAANAKLQDLKNVGSGTGYYITNGYAVPITWEKSSRDSQTVYKYQDGSEIEVNDGNTFIQIYPSNGGSLSIS